MNDVYGRTVVFQSTDGVSDFYLIGSAITLAVPTGSSAGVVLVACARQGKLAMAQQTLYDFIDSKYSQRIMLYALYIYNDAVDQGFTNRAAYVQNLFVYTRGIIAYLSTMVTAINASTSPSTIAAMQFDQSQFGADPGYTGMAALAIPN
jgi:hypothetical protein